MTDFEEQLNEINERARAATAALNAAYETHLERTKIITVLVAACFLAALFVVVALIVELFIFRPQN